MWFVESFEPPSSNHHPGTTTVMPHPIVAYQQCTLYVRTIFLGFWCVELSFVDDFIQIIDTGGF